MTRRALAILRREGGPVCFFALLVVPIGLLLSFCLVGFPIVTYGLGGLVSTLVRGAHDEHGLPFRPARPGWAGALALFGIAALLGTTLVGSGAAGAALGSDHAIAQTLAAVVAAAMAGAALAPFALAPVIAAAGGVAGAVQPIGRSVELAIRIGARRLAALGAATGALVGGAFLACSMAAVLSESAVVIVAAVLALLAVPIVALALLADAYVRLSLAEAEERAARPREPARAHPSTEATPPPVAERAPRQAGIGLRTLALVLVPLLVLPTAVVLVAALTPTPMRPLGEVWLRETYPVRVDGEDHDHAIGARASVRIVAGGVLVTTPDGGGAGYIRTRFDPHTGVLAVRDGTAYAGPGGSYAVIVEDGCRELTCSAYTLVDANGVRLDDSLEDRVLGRLGIVGGAAVALGLLLLLVLAGRLGLSLGEARTLDAPDLAAAGKGVRRALEGELSVSGATLTRSRGAMRIEGDAWIVADGLRIRLPQRPIPALGEREPRDGQPVVLISRFRTALTANLREAGPAWPDDGLLVLGTREDAREALSRRAATAAAWIALPLGACVFTATAVLLASL